MAAGGDGWLLAPTAPGDGSRRPMWIYRAGERTLWIRFTPRGGGRFLLGADEEELAVYYSPEAAADDVYLGKTGCETWDRSAPGERPFDLGAWTRIDCCDWAPAGASYGETVDLGK